MWNKYVQKCYENKTLLKKFILYYYTLILLNFIQYVFTEISLIAICSVLV